MNREELIKKAVKAISDESWHLQESFADAYARIAFAVFEEARTPTDDEVRLATLAAVKMGAKSDAEAVRNYREAERVIRAAIPHLHRTVQGEPSDAQVLAAVDAFMASQSESEDGPTLVHRNMAAALIAAAAVQGGETR